MGYTAHSCKVNNTEIPDYLKLVFQPSEDSKSASRNTPKNNRILIKH